METILETPILSSDYVYPIGRALRMIVHGELKQHRCVMIYVEQVGKRHIDVRLTRVFTPITRAHHTQIWTLRSTVDARIANREDPIMRVDGNVDARATHRAILPCG